MCLDIRCRLVQQRLESRKELIFQLVLFYRCCWCICVLTPRSLHSRLHRLGHNICDPCSHSCSLAGSVLDRNPDLLAARATWKPVCSGGARVRCGDAKTISGWETWWLRCSFRRWKGWGPGGWSKWGGTLAQTK